jgi:hypothetical protein
MRTDSPLLHFYYSKLPKARGGQTTDGCSAGYYKHPLTGECVPNGTALSQVIAKSNPQKPSEYIRPNNVTDVMGRTPLQILADNQTGQEINSRNIATNKRQFLNQGQATTKESEARRKMLTQQAVSNMPNVIYDEQTGTTSAVNPNMTYEGEPANFMGERQQKSIDHIVGALDAAGYITGVGELAGLGYRGLKTAIGESIESGLLSKFKPNKLKSISSSTENVGNIFKQTRAEDKNYLKFLDKEMRVNSLPKSQNKEALNVFEDFKTRIQTPEGQKRMKELGIDSDELLRKVSIREDPNTYGYYNGNPHNIIAIHPEHPLARKVTRHELEHAVQNAMKSSKMKKAINASYEERLKILEEPSTTNIDKMLSDLELRKEGTPDKVWDVSKIESDQPVDMSEYKSLISNKQNATDYFLSGSKGREKSSYAAEVQQYMMDNGVIPKTSYTEITPEMVKDTHVDAMFDEEGGGKYLRLFNIMKPTDANYKLISDALNKMMTVTPVVGAGAVGAATLNQKAYGGLLSRTVTCSRCGHSWKGVDGGIDPTTCHKCGGMIKMKDGGPGPGDGKTNPPIYVNDRNDPRLRAYGDTTRANESTQLLLNALKEYNKNPTDKNKKKYWEAQNNNYNWINKFNTTNHPAMNGKGEGWTSQNAPDGNPDVYFTYPKAVQPIIYRPEPKLKPRPFVPATKIPMGQPSTGMQIQQRSFPKLDIPNVEMSGPYMAGYTDYDTQQGVDRGFRSAEERDAFVEQLRQRQAGNYQPSQGNISSYYDVNKRNKKYGGDISIPALTTKMPALYLGGSTQMQPKQSPLLDYYLQRTGGKRMIR